MKVYDMYLSFCIVAAVFKDSASSCSGTGFLTSQSGTLHGPTNYTANDLCMWTLEPANAASVSVTLGANTLAPGSTISIYSCSTAICTSPVKLETCSVTSSACSETVQSAFAGEPPIMMVKFQGGPLGIASPFTMTYTSVSTFYCPDSDCSSYCSASTGPACLKLSNCQLQSSSSSSTPTTCSCVWTDGKCSDLGSAVSLFVGTVLVRKLHF